MQPTPAFLPGKSSGQRSLVGYSPWGHKSVRHDLVTKQQQCLLEWKIKDLIENILLSVPPSTDLSLTALQTEQVHQFGSWQQPRSLAKNPPKPLLHPESLGNGGFQMNEIFHKLT